MTSKVGMTRADYKIFYTVTTRWMDNDIYGHVNNVTYYSYFDSAVNIFLINYCGLDIHKGEIIGFVVSSDCEFLAPIAFPDKIEVGLRIDYLGNSSVRYGLGIFKDKEIQVCAFGHFVHVFVDRESNKPVNIPAYLRKNMHKIALDNASQFAP